MTQRIIEDISGAIADVKGRDLTVIDVRGRSDMTDYYMICTGTSARHTAAIASRVREALRRDGFRTWGVEGEKGGDWVLVDAGSVVLHIMMPEAREAYRLEQLYSMP